MELICVVEVKLWAISSTLVCARLCYAELKVLTAI